ncbi:MAG: NAD(P)/FAD-dependent oxidoreductase [Pseudomonadota bacterium]
MGITKTAVISGAGPCGLAAALMLHARGWERIHVVERNPSATIFDKNKGFNYLIDARGQKLLKQLGIADRLEHYGVENRRNVMTMVTAEGEHKTFKSPFWDPARDSAYWSRRERLQALLYDRVEEINTDGRIVFHFNHVFVGMKDGQSTVLAKDLESGEEKVFSADFVLGCDGLKSSVRDAMVAHSGLTASAFDREKFPSPSSQLFYKVLQIPAHVTLKGDLKAADDHKMAYAFLARHTEPDKAMAMVAYPVSSPDEPRTVNIIRLPGHHIWTIKDADALFAFLEDAFPQMPIRDVLTQQEAEDFISIEAPKFPAPQYTKMTYASLGKGQGVPALLIGDAAHAFPPDLGLGVNTAMEDVWRLSEFLERSGDDPAAAGQAFDADQARERRALAKLVQTVAPYQYNQSPGRLKLWALKFFAVKLLNKVLPFLIDRPAVLLAQQDHLPFSQIRRRQVFNRWKIGALVGAIVGGVAWAL